MHTLSPADITLAMRALFEREQPTLPRALNVLAGISSGDVLVDAIGAQRWVAVREASYKTLYLGGEFDATIVAQLIDYFRQRGGVGFSCWLDDPLNALLPANAGYDGRALYSPMRDQRVALQPLGEQLPPGYRLAERDTDLLVRSPDLNALIAEFGSLERVLAQTYGVMVLHGDLVVCEASTGAAGGGRVEIGVGTQELYRRRGLARAACAQLILHCEAAGYLTWWDCAAHNTASIALAHALGYRNLHEYRYQWWEATGCVPAERDAQ